MSDNLEEEKEPSIDEILASIRQIISDDEEEEEEKVAEEAVAEPEPVAAEPEPEPEEEVVELTEVIEEPEPEPEEEDDGIELEMSDPEPEPEPIPEPEPEPEPFPEAEPEDLEDLDTEILTQSAAAATLAGFTKLARDIQVSRSFDGITLEDIVRSQLEPLLSEWLDKNLPSIIDRLVREELEKISKRASGE